jgi:hypothetical protein
MDHLLPWSSKQPSPPTLRLSVRRFATAAVSAVFVLGALCVPAHAATPKLSVLYETPAPQTATNQAEPWFQIVNNGTAAVSLANVTLRYWFTADNPGVTQQFNCDWAQIGCTNLKGALVALAKPVPLANKYLELSFTAGAPAVSAGASSGQIQTRFNDAGWPYFNQANDYSFNAAATSFTTSSTVTLYYQGQLIWGVEPAGAAVSTPAPTRTATPRATPTPTRTPVRTATPTRTPVRTPTPTRTPARTANPTRTPAPTASPQPTAKPTSASPSPTPGPSSTPPVSSGTINFHFYYGVSPETPQDSITLAGDNYTDLIMSNIIAGAMYGHLIQTSTPGMQFNKDYLYGSIFGQLLQENIATEYYRAGTNLIDPSSNQIAVMGTGQGGPYQINNYAVDMVAGSYAPSGFSLINYAAIQKNIGFTMAEAATQFFKPTPPSFNNKYYAPLLTAYFHFNDYRALQYIGGTSLTQKWTPASSSWTPQWQPYFYESLGVFGKMPNNFLDILLNVAYNQGYYGSLFLAECKLGANATAATIKAVNDYGNAWDGNTYEQYPYQVHNYIDQLYGNPTPSSSDLSAVGPSNNHVAFNLAALGSVFRSAFQTLAYVDGSGAYDYIPAAAAATAFNAALGSAALSSADTLDLSNAANRSKIFGLLETAIGNLEKNLKTDFTATTMKGL